jgi:hypothetical protein
MVERGGVFIYESWCDRCLAVTQHNFGDCLTCVPVGFPRPAVVLVEEKPYGGKLVDAATTVVPNPRELRPLPRRQPVFLCVLAFHSQG